MKTQSENKKVANRHTTGRNRCASVGDFAFERPTLDVDFFEERLGRSSVASFFARTVPDQIGADFPFGFSG